VNNLAGHYPPEISRAMEDSFADLLERIGYRVLRKRDVESGLDIIATFNGEPINPRPVGLCKLLRPFFSPTGTTAFSLKRGNFIPRDVSELVEKFQRAKNSLSEPLSSLEGMVIVTNYTRTEADIDELLSEHIYCWEGRRLAFYSAKVRAIQNLALGGPTREIPIDAMPSSSYLIQTESSKSAIAVNVAIFVDVHDKNLVVSSDHTDTMLKFVYEKSLKPIVDSTQLVVNVMSEMHVLGLADSNLIGNSFNKYAAEFSSHPKVFFLEKPMVFQYGSAPWAVLFQWQKAQSSSMTVAS